MSVNSCYYIISEGGCNKNILGASSKKKNVGGGCLFRIWEYLTEILWQKPRKKVLWSKLTNFMVHDMTLKKWTCSNLAKKTPEEHLFREKNPVQSQQKTKTIEQSSFSFKPLPLKTW